MRKVLNSRIFKIIYTVFVIIFTIFIASYLLFICLERKTIFDYAFYIVPDNSMQRSYSKNDVVVAKKIDKLILEVGNDIVYYGNAGGLEGRLIIHRITSIDNSNKKDVLFTTQSINSSLPDPAIQKKAILGKVLGKVDILTSFNHLVKNQMGFFLVIFLPLVLILTVEIMKTMIALKLENVALDKIKESETKEETEEPKNSKHEEELEILDVDDRGKDEKKNKK